MRRLKGLIGLVLTVALVAVCVYAWMRIEEYRRFVDTPFPTEETTRYVAIPKGANFQEATSLLWNEGLISDRRAFTMLARLKGVSRQIQAGEYEFKTPITPLLVLDSLVKGSVVIRKFTIPEGYDLKQIALELEKAGLGKSVDFIGKAKSGKTANLFEIDAQSLEGYLFPDTYRYSKAADQDQIMYMMVRRFAEVFDNNMRKRASELGMSVHEVITLASIIEKETGQSSERPLIASVFHNRLRKGMKLQSDPTVIYGIKDFDGNIRKKDLTMRTPYNTYMIDGLPPGPVCSPGEASIKAALWPAESDYFYFVSKNDGSHLFSKTYRQHIKAVREYQINGRGN